MCASLQFKWTEALLLCATAHLGEWVYPNGEAKAVWMILPDFFYRQVIKRKKWYRVLEVEQRMLWGIVAEYGMLLKASGLIRTFLLVSGILSFSRYHKSLRMTLEEPI